MARSTLALALILAILACGENNTGPDDLPLAESVRISVAKTSFSIGEPIEVTLTNISSREVHVYGSCPPSLDEWEGDVRWRSRPLCDCVCPAELPRTSPLAPGASLRALVTAEESATFLAPGTYRKSYSISGSEGGPPLFLSSDPFTLHEPQGS